MKGSLERDLGHIHVSPSTDGELEGLALASYLVAWCLFLVVVYHVCTLAIGWSLVP